MLVEACQSHVCRARIILSVPPWLFPHRPGAIRDECAINGPAAWAWRPFRVDEIRLEERGGARRSLKKIRRAKSCFRALALRTLACRRRIIDANQIAPL